MDYEMKQTIAIMKKMVADGKITQEDAEKYCPEMAESEDERIKNLIYCIIRDRGDVRNLLEANGFSVDKAIDWLERQSEQKTVEWSEDEDTMLKAVILNLEELKKHCAISSIQYLSKCIDWLNTLKPRNKWKPSDEQMEALQYYKSSISNKSSLYNTLGSLLEQLKAL